MAPNKDTKHQQAKSVIAPWRKSLYNLDIGLAKKNLSQLSPQVIHVGHPFGDFSQTDMFFDTVYAPLIKAWPDMERRDYIVMAGEDNTGKMWVGCAGYYTGTFLSPWLDIPSTGHQVHMRFHEFYNIDNQQVPEIHILWDIPEVMVQAQAWPLAPSLGKIWHVPAPATQDGLDIDSSEDKEQSSTSLQLVINMLNSLQKHPRESAPAMDLERFWHDKMNWYGPTGIGTARGIAGFRHWHQIPFLNAMPDRGQRDGKVKSHFFAEGNYVGVTGWPNMMQTLNHAGWLGIPPVDRLITLRSLDFWRIENHKIRENWVLVDLLDMYNQIGVDVFARLREFNKAKHLAPIDFQKDY